MLFEGDVVSNPSITSHTHTRDYQTFRGLLFLVDHSLFFRVVYFFSSTSSPFVLLRSPCMRLFAIRMRVHFFSNTFVCFLVSICSSKSLPTLKIFTLKRGVKKLMRNRTNLNPSELQFHVCVRFFTRWLLTDRHRKPTDQHSTWTSDAMRKSVVETSREFNVCNLRWREVCLLPNPHSSMSFANPSRLMQSDRKLGESASKHSFYLHSNSLISHLIVCVLGKREISAAVFGNSYKGVGHEKRWPCKKRRASRETITKSTKQPLKKTGPFGLE